MSGKAHLLLSLRIADFRIPLFVRERPLLQEDLKEKRPSSFYRRQQLSGKDDSSLLHWPVVYTYNNTLHWNVFSSNFTYYYGWHVSPLSNMYKLRILLH